MEETFRGTLRDMDFVPTVADPEISHRRVRKPNFEDYYELLLVYMDYVLCCLHNHQMIIDALALTHDMKDRSVGPTKIYLSAEIKKYQVRSGKYHLSMLSTQYVKNAIETVELLLKDE